MVSLHNRQVSHIGVCGVVACSMAKAMKLGKIVQSTLENSYMAVSKVVAYTHGQTNQSTLGNGKTT